MAQAHRSCALLLVALLGSLVFAPIAWAHDGTNQPACPFKGLAQALALLPGGRAPAKERTCTGCKLLTSANRAGSGEALCELRCANCTLPQGGLSGFVKLELWDCAPENHGISVTTSGTLECHPMLGKPTRPPRNGGKSPGKASPRPSGKPGNGPKKGPGAKPKAGKRM